MTKLESGQTSFLEAHYYSSGLRQHSVSLAGVRPSWAPEPDTVGFRNEFPLFEGDAVIEFQRMIHQGSRVTWLALYGPSTDEKLGNRANHSGVGIWLRDVNVVDVRSVMQALKQLKSLLGPPFNQVKFDSQASKFLSDWLPKYVKPFEGYVPGFAGVQFSDVPLLSTKIYGAAKAGQPDVYDLVADQLLKLSFHPDSGVQPPRSLIHIADVEYLNSKDFKNETLSPDIDVISEFISAIPEIINKSSQSLIALSENNRKLEKMNRENLENNRKLAESYNVTIRERDELRDRLNNIERGRGPAPIPADTERILAALARIDRRIEGAQSSPEYTDQGSAPLFYTLLGSFGVVLFALIFWSIARFGPPFISLLRNSIP